MGNDPPPDETKTDPDVVAEQEDAREELAEIALEVGRSGGVSDGQLQRIAALRERLVRLEAGL